MGRRPANRHLGLDLGGTNIKWALVQRAGDEWRTVDHAQVPTQAELGPPAVVSRLADVGAQAVARWPNVSSVGVGVPGLYDPATGATRFLPNLPGDWAGVPVAAAVGEALGLPVRLI
ncbi:MAG: ROK family protein, partial [Chloroflexota bacterium]|nr:ROK family protein [Chloroflexota bacterium]